MGVQVSVVMPAFNEAENLQALIPETIGALEALGATFEILVVDDGSTDGTVETMRHLVEEEPGVRHLRLRRNTGKSGALAAGLAAVQGETVVLMDADGQDDPAEIARLLDALGGGLDLVTGSRRGGRHDRLVKRQTSKFYNWTTARLSGVEGRDFNSGFKAMRREVADGLGLYGELHRYIPVLAAWHGYRVGEVLTAHRPRLHGSSKYGLNRFWRGMFDLATVRFLTTYNARPFHLFGGLGAVLLLAGSGLLAWMGVEKFVFGHGIGDRPALLVGVLLSIAALQLMSLGLVAELLLHFRHAKPPDAEELNP